MRCYRRHLTHLTRLIDISITAHSGFINGFLAAIGHPTFSLPTGGMSTYLTSQLLSLIDIPLRRNSPRSGQSYPQLKLNDSAHFYLTSIFRLVPPAIMYTDPSLSEPPSPGHVIFYQNTAAKEARVRNMAGKGTNIHFIF